MKKSDKLLQEFGTRVRDLRKLGGLSQEDLALKCGLDRTYVSQVEGGKRNISLNNIQALALALNVSIAAFFSGTLPSDPSAFESSAYRVNDRFSTFCGFEVTGTHIQEAAQATARQIQLLPFSLFQSIDLKTLSSIVGALFASDLAATTGAIVNPIEKGHPDILPRSAASASEAELRNYPEGLEIKVTVGNVKQGSDLLPGVPRIDQLVGVTWQAHHREVERLLGLVVDFAGPSQKDVRYPIITAAFYADTLIEDDWGKVSGTTGRNTKVSGMRTSGKRKMGNGWVLLLDDRPYVSKYASMLAFETEL